jgi:hypothetical protein
MEVCKAVGETNTTEIGALMQDYLRARWGRTPDKEAAEELGGRLDRALRNRLDVLGADAERLLDIEPARMMTELEALEREAALEDADAESAARRTQAQETGKSRTKPQGRGQPAPSRGQRQPGRRRSQRGQR